MRAAKSGGGAELLLLRAAHGRAARATSSSCCATCAAPSTKASCTCVYQPKIHAPSGEITGAEALMRWEHPLRGVVGPDDVHPDRRALRPDRRDRQLADRRGLPAGRRSGATQGLRMRVAINLSAHQLRHADLADRIDVRAQAPRDQPAAADLRDHRIGGDGRRVERDPHGRAARAQLGVNISIDDFGTGYSSLAVPAEAARRRAEDRPQLRARPRDQRRRARGRRRASSSWRRRSASRSSPRASRPRRSTRSCARSAATSCRATCSRGRCRRGRFDLGDGGRRPARARLPRLALPGRRPRGALH